MRHPRVDCFMVLLLVALSGWTEDGKGIICGRVLWPDGKPAKRAMVRIDTASPSAPPAAPGSFQKADRKGKFCFHSLPSGSYVLSVDHVYAYMQLCAAETVDLEKREDANADLVLGLCMELWPQPPMIDVDESMMTTVFDIDKLENIPQGSAGGR